MFLIAQASLRCQPGFFHRGSTNTEPAVVATGRMLDYGHQLCQRPLLGIDAILS